MMKILHGNELFPFIHGTLSMSSDASGAICLDRFTQRQYNRYEIKAKELGIDFFLNARAASGIFLDLTTDSSFIGMKYRLYAACRSFGGFDCYVDGVFYDHVFIEDLSLKVLCFELPKGTHRVQIHFPWSLIIAPEQLILDDGAKAEPVSKSCRILALGDSITQGYILKHPSLTYVSSLTGALNAETVNQGVGGWFFDSGSLDERLADFRPNVITVAYGTNDYSWNPDALERLTDNCRSFTERLMKIFPEAKVLGILPIYRADYENTARNRMHDFKRDEGIEIIRGIYESFPDITVLDGGFYPRHSDFFAPDSLHPNDLGSVFYANAVTEAIRKLIQ